MLLPSKAIWAAALVPSEWVPSVAPLGASNLVTVKAKSFATHILVPSKAIASGPDPTARFRQDEYFAYGGFVTAARLCSTTLARTEPKEIYRQFRKKG